MDFPDLKATKLRLDAVVMCSPLGILCQQPSVVRMVDEADWTMENGRIHFTLLIRSIFLIRSTCGLIGDLIE